MQTTVNKIRDLMHCIDAANCDDHLLPYHRGTTNHMKEDLVDELMIKMGEGARQF